MLMKKPEKNYIDLHLLVETKQLEELLSKGEGSLYLTGICAPQKFRKRRIHVRPPQKRNPHFDNKINWKKRCGFDLKEYVRSGMRFERASLTFFPRAARQRIRESCNALAKEHGIKAKNLDERIRSTIRHEIFMAKRRR